MPRRLVVARIVYRRWSCFLICGCPFQTQSPHWHQKWCLVIVKRCSLFQTWSKYRLKTGAAWALQLLKISVKWGLPSFISKAGRQWSSVFLVSCFAFFFSFSFSVVALRRVYFSGKQSCRWQTIQAPLDLLSGGMDESFFIVCFLIVAASLLAGLGRVSPIIWASPTPHKVPVSFTALSVQLGIKRILKSCVTWAVPLLSSAKHFQALTFKSLGSSPCFIIIEN